MAEGEKNLLIFPYFTFKAHPSLVLRKLYCYFQRGNKEGGRRERGKRKRENQEEENSTAVFTGRTLNTVTECFQGLTCLPRVQFYRDASFVESRKPTNLAARVSDVGIFIDESCVKEFAPGTV